MQKNLYRKYRPKKFGDIYGQEKIVSILKEQINRNKTHFAYLFSGIQGVGKTSTARILSRSINCLENEMGESCEKCKICLINKKNLIDVFEIDAASNNGVEQIRNLKEKAIISPSKSKKKIYIIDEVHMLSKSAYNAFLKLLEEPPTHVIFILATTQLFKIPETILSRCQIFEFLPLSENILSKLLLDIAKKENISFEEEALKLISRKTKGSVREALNILEQTSFLTKDKKITVLDLRSFFGMTSKETIEQFLISLIKKDKKKALDIINKLIKNGINFRVFYFNLIDELIEQISFKILNKENEESFFNLINIKELKGFLDIFIDKYSLLKNLNLIQVLRLIVLENIDFEKNNIGIIENNFFEVKKQKFNNIKINEKKISILKCLDILNNRNKDIIEAIKINWISFEKYLEHKTFNKFAKLLFNSKIICASENEILIKTLSEIKRNELNIFFDNEEYLNFIEKILGKKYKIFSITKEEQLILKIEYEKSKK